MAELLLTIERIPSEELADVKRVEVPHTNDAVYCLSADGRRWIRKREENMGWQELYAEAIGHLLARRLEIPVPNAAVCLNDEHRSWLSECVPDVAHWHHSRVPFITNLESLGSMLTLDAIIGNSDRHARNILLQPSPDEQHLKIWLIDMGSSLIAHADDYIQIGLEPPSSDNHARGIPLDLDAVQEGLTNTALAAGRITAQEIKNIISYSSQIVKEGYSEQLAMALYARCQKAKQIADIYANTIRGRQ